MKNIKIFYNPIIFQRNLTILLICILLIGCGGGGGSDGSPTNITNNATYSISGTIAGLSGTVVLRNNGGDDLTRSANGSFTFATPITQNGTYSVTIQTQPNGQTCSVSNDSGTVSSSNVTNVAVNCVNNIISNPNNYTIGGTISGLDGTVVLRNNGGDDLTRSANGSFTFATPIAHGGTYSVIIQTQPTGQTCSVANGSGTVSGTNVTTVAISCSNNSYTIGGTISGLDGTVVLRNNGGDDLTRSTDDSFTFTTPITQASTYSVTIQSQPTGQTCSVANGSGTVSGTNVTTVAISCSNNSYTIGGTISGLDGTVVLRNNGGDDLTRSANGSFTFATPIAHGGTYTVSIQTQPTGQTCSVANGSGFVSGTNVTTVAISCSNNSYTIGGTISGLDGTVVLHNVSGFTGSDLLTLTDNGSFAFAIPVIHNDTYEVTIQSQPEGQLCSITNGVGSVVGANVTLVEVNCVITPPEAPDVSIEFDIKSALLSWPSASNTTHYQLYKKTDEGSGYNLVETNLTTTNYEDDLAVHLIETSNLSYIVSACNSAGCTDSTPLTSINLNQAVGYIKASNTNTSDYFGYTVSMSSDGTTLAIGAIQESSNATGIGGNENDNSSTYSGAVYVYINNGTTWEQQAYIKASNSGGSDRFGWSLALSNDGNTLAVGAPYEDSNATGIDGDQASNLASDSGAAYIFTRIGTSWSQQAYIKASNTDAGDLFGHSITLSSSGNTLVVGAPLEGSSATGVNGNQGNILGGGYGAAYAFTRTGDTWIQQAYIKASNSDPQDRFGHSLALSSDGSTLAVGSYLEDSFATGINGDQSDNSFDSSGAVYIFHQSSGNWSQDVYIKASNTNEDDWFGYSLDLSQDGNTLAVAAVGEDSAGTGINADQFDNSMPGAGAVYVFTRDGTSWSQETYLKASNTSGAVYFGHGLSLSSDGNILGVGAPHGAPPTITILPSLGIGEIYIFERSLGIWSQINNMTGPNSTFGDYFGVSISLSSTGDTLAVGAFMEDSNAIGIGGDQSNNSNSDSGAVYLY